VVTLHSRRERIEQLADLLDGTRTEDEVRSDVRRLATLASTVHDEVELPVLDAEARDRIRTTVMAGVYTDLQEAESARTAPARPRTARRVVATGVASVLIGTGGVAVAAQEALPGDALYGIKQATESFRLAAAGDHTEQGRVELALARERLDEVTAAVTRGDVRDQDLIDTLARMDERSRSGSQILVQVAVRDDEAALLEEVATFTERQARGIVDVFDQLPVQVRPHAEDSLATLRAIRDQLLAPALGGAVGAAEFAGIEAALRSAPLPPAPPTTTEIESEVSESSSTSRSTGTAPLPDDVGDAPGPSLPLPAPGTGDGSGDRTVVPRLPGALDDVGQTVDETVGDVVDGTGRLLEETLDTVDDALDDVGGTVGDVGEVVDGTVGGVGEVVDGLLGRSRDGD
jgi:hypothetical protein